MLLVCKKEIKTTGSGLNAWVSITHKREWSIFMLFILADNTRCTDHIVHGLSAKFCHILFLISHCRCWPCDKLCIDTSRMYFKYRIWNIMHKEFGLTFVFGSTQHAYSSTLRFRCRHLLVKSGLLVIVF